MRRREYTAPPPVVTGYPLDNFSVSFYKPRAGVNLVTNPSVERGTTGYTAVGGSVAQSALRQRFGVYSLEVTPSTSSTSGVYYGSIDLSSGQLYVASVYGYFRAGNPYTIYFANTSGTLLGTAYTFYGRGRWERVWVEYVETTSTSRRIYITKNGGASEEPFYIDALQVEADVLTSYIDGDQRGFVKGQQAYYWTGTAHASASVRVLGTRSGGEEMKLRDYGFSVLAIVGMGLTGFSNLSTPNAYVGGAQFERTVYTERNFDIVGTFQSETPSRLQQLRSDLGNILRPNAGIITQPLMLRIQTLDNCGKARGEIMEVPCSLEPSSLAGNWNNYYQDPVTLSFRVYLPYAGAEEGGTGAEMDFQDTHAVTAWTSVVEKTSGGNWGVLSITLNGELRDMKFNPYDGRLYIGGLFTTSTTRIGAYNFNTSTLESIGDPGGQVNGIAFMANGDVIVAMGAVAAGEVKRYSLSAGTWSSLGTSAGGLDFINGVVVGHDDTIYALGGFTSINAVSATNVAKYSGGSWTAMGSGTTSNARNGVVAPSGHIFIAAGNDVYEWTGTALTNIGAADSTVYGLSVGLDGRIYAIGDFSTIDGVAAENVAVWNGVTWSPLGDGLGNTGLAIATLGDGIQFVGGSFSGAGNLKNVLGAAVWNLSDWAYFDLDAGTGIIKLGYSPERGSLFTVYEIGTTTIKVGVVNVLTNDGTADTYPTFEFLGPGRVYQIKNYTTGDILYFNLALNAGERATLTLGPGNVSFTSTFRGNIINTLIPGSYLATFRLVPGENAVGAFIAGSTDSDTKLTAYWETLYLSFDDALYKP